MDALAVPSPLWIIGGNVLKQKVWLEVIISNEYNLCLHIEVCNKTMQIQKNQVKKKLTLARLLH